MSKIFYSKRSGRLQTSTSPKMQEINLSPKFVRHEFQNVVHFAFRSAGTRNVIFQVYVFNKIIRTRDHQFVT